MGDGVGHAGTTGTLSKRQSTPETTTVSVGSRQADGFLQLGISVDSIGTDKRELRDARGTSKS